MQKHENKLKMLQKSSKNVLFKPDTFYRYNVTVGNVTDTLDRKVCDQSYG